MINKILFFFHLNSITFKFILYFIFFFVMAKTEFKIKIMFNETRQTFLQFSWSLIELYSFQVVDQGKFFFLVSCAFGQNFFLYYLMFIWIQWQNIVKYAYGVFFRRLNMKYMDKLLEFVLNRKLLHITTV